VVKLWASTDTDFHKSISPWFLFKMKAAGELPPHISAILSKPIT